MAYACRNAYLNGDFCIYNSRIEKGSSLKFAMCVYRVCTNMLLFSYLFLSRDALGSALILLSNGAMLGLHTGLVYRQ